MKTVILLLFGYLLIELGSSGHIDHKQPDFRYVPSGMFITLLKNYGSVLGDILWLKVIQDFGYCEGPESAKSYNSGVSLDDILTQHLPSSRCKKSLVYQMIDAITEFNPRFKNAHKLGAISLSIGVDDREGAGLIFEKALQRFPDDWTIAFAASYHYLFEMQNAERAADLLLQASRYGGPKWLPVLASRLYSQAGREALAKNVLESYIKTHPGGEAEERAKKKLSAIESASHK